jgi:5'(3')-deoxyribonucleotidase
MKTKTVLITLDTCLFDTVGFVLGQLEKFHPQIKLSREDFNTNRWKDAIPDKFALEKITAAYNALEYRYKLALPTMGSQVAYEVLAKSSCNIRILSQTRPSGHSIASRGYKKRWVRRYFGDEAASGMIFLGKREMVKSDVLVSSHLNQLSHLPIYDWLMFSQPFNEKYWYGTDHLHSPKGRIDSSWTNFKEEFQKIGIAL